MVERFLSQTTFSSQEDFIKNLKINVPENFNFGYDIVDAWAAEEPNKSALLWTNDKGEHVQFTFADMKHYTDITASYFQSLGIGRGDMVMLILKRRYEFWFSIIALHKLGATVIPATHLLTKKDIVYRCNAADIKMIVAAGEEVITKHMWPVSVIPPRYPETYVICLTDKYCGSREIMDHYAKIIQNKYWGKPFAWFLKQIFAKVPRADLLQEMLPELVSMERAASPESSFAQQRSRRSSRWNHPSGRRPRRS